MQALSDKGQCFKRSVWNAFLEGKHVVFAEVLVLERDGATDGNQHAIFFP